MDESDEICRMVLLELRNIIRAFDIQSKYLEKQYGLTGPQLLILQELKKTGESTVSAVAKKVSLSQATTTTVLDRLEQRNLIRKTRSTVDKRRVYAEITDEGVTLISGNPHVLQERFISRFKSLPKWEQTSILSVIQRVVSMIDADKVQSSSDFSDNSI
jgi:DNA-binding MarR family transcriptional regulator